MYIIRLTEEKKGNRLELVQVHSDNWDESEDNPDTILFSTYLPKSIPIRMEMHMGKMSHIIGSPISASEKIRFPKLDALPQSYKEFAEQYTFNPEERKDVEKMLKAAEEFEPESRYTKRPRNKK